MPVTVPVGYETEGAQLDADMTRDAKRAGGKAGKAGGQSFSTGFKSLIKPLAGLGAGLAVKNFLGDAISEARESQKVGALSEQVIRSTGGAANVTAKQMGDLATAIGKVAGIDDETIQAGENLLATFTNVRNETGRGNDIFTRAAQASTDLAAGLAAASGSQINLRSSTLQLGKALNDPVKGIAALGRAGVQFDDQQKAQIKTLVKQGKTLQAQRIILDQVAKKYGGAAASQATASDKARFAVKNLEEQIGTALLPVLDKAANKVSKDVVPAVSQFITEMQDGTGRGGEFADVLKTDVLPVAKNLGREVILLGHALEPVLHLLQALPPQAVAFGGASGILGARLGSLRTPLDSTASGFERVGRGAANLAGGAGLLAVADAANRTNPVLGGLEAAAGGAATGLAVGGPLGAAVGGIVGGLLGVFSSGKKAATGIELSRQASKDAAADLDVLSDSITDVTKGYDALARKQIGQALVKALGGGEQAAETVTNLGLSIQTLTQAALGNPKAMAEVAAATDKASGAVVAASQNIQSANEPYLGLSKSQRDAATAAAEVTTALNALSGKTKEERAQAILAQLQTEKFAAALRGVPTKTVVDIGTEGVLEARNDIASVANSLGQQGFTKKQIDKKISILLATAGLPHSKAEIDALRAYANQLDGKTVTVTLLTSLKRRDALGLGDLPPRAMGGPVTAGQPYMVGERRPEIFVPNQSGRIVPSVGQYASTVASEQAPSFTYAPSFYGPTTGRERLDEMRWNQRYATRARVAR